MKLLGKLLFWLIISVGVIYGALFSYSLISDAQVKGIATILSPLPSLLVDTVVKDHNASYAFWFPSEKKRDTKLKKLDVTAKSAISYELNTDTLLFDKDTDEKLPIASLTKVMTAIVTLETMDLDKQVTVSEHAATIGENVMGLSTGETLSVEELLYGLILNSGNDAAEVLAEESPYGRDEFVFIMNKKAESLGLSNTRFSNASGLEGDGRQYSTVKDLLILTRYALTFPEFAKIAATYEHEIPATSTHKYFLLYNQTNLLTTYPGVKGVKTGYTDEAGLCLITYLEYKGHRIVAVLLNSENRRQDMKELLDYSLKSLGEVPPVHN